jgi:hypothetical protein
LGTSRLNGVASTTLYGLTFDPKEREAVVMLEVMTMYSSRHPWRASPRRRHRISPD